MPSITKYAPTIQVAPRNSIYDLHRAGQALGHTILSPKKNILSIKRDDLASYIQTNYTADHMVLVGAGGVDHGELVKAAEKAFGTLPVSPNLNPAQPQGSPQAGLHWLGRCARVTTTFQQHISP
jgi:predicted Zn-dependent peptidase